MLGLEPSRLTARLGQALQTLQPKAAQAPEPSVNLGTAPQAVRVTLSEQVRSRVAQKNDDIDNRSLPDSIKQTLKMIRELRTQMAERIAELQALMQDQSMDKETRRQRAQALQGELSSLNGALASASAALVKMMRAAPEQLQEVAKLSQA